MNKVSQQKSDATISLKTFYTDISTGVWSWRNTNSYSPYNSDFQALTGPCAPNELGKRIQTLHETICAFKGDDSLVQDPDDPTKKIEVEEYLARKRKKETSKGDSCVKLFSEDEPFDIEKVMKPPQEHIDAVKEKVLNDAYDWALKEIQEEDQEDMTIEENWVLIDIK